MKMNLKMGMKQKHGAQKHTSRMRIISLRRWCFCCSSTVSRFSGTETSIIDLIQQIVWSSLQGSKEL